MLTHAPSRDEILAERCRRSLRVFTQEAWPIIEPQTPFVHGWHLDVLAEHLEAVSRGEIKRLIINVPPRTMKSIMCCVMWPSWEWLSSPHLRLLFATYSDRLSQRDSLKMRRLLRSEGGKEDGTLFERIGYRGVLSMLMDEPWELEKDQDAKSRYDTTATGFRLATSVKGMGTGEGGDRIVVDDPLSAKDAESDADRNFVNSWWDGTMTTRFNNDQAAAVIIMQRLHEEDLTGHLVERGGWHHLCLPAEYEPSHPFVYPATVKIGDKELQGDRRTEAGELLEPIRLGTERLDELRRDLGSYGFAGQMQQRPAPAEGGMFKEAWWQRYDELPTFTSVIASWDMRFGDSQKASSSYVVGQVWGVTGADRYLIGQVRGKFSFTESVKAVQAIAEWKPEAVSKLVEKKANGAAVIDTLKSEVPGLIPIEPEGGKDVRAAAIQPFIEAGNVWLPAAGFIPAPPGYAPTSVDDFIGECSAFPNAANDDQVDAMTQALNWLHNKQPKKIPDIGPVSITGQSSFR